MTKQLKKLKKRVAALEGRAAQPGPQGPAGPQGAPGAPGQPGTNTSAPAGAVSFFNRSTCPSGWTELTAARGRYLVGSPAGGTLGGTVGTPLSNLQNRAVGQHNHGVTDPGHSHTVSFNIGVADTGSFAQIDQDATSTALRAFNTFVSATGITINNAGAVAGTNAPYLQLLVCQKS